MSPYNFGGARNLPDVDLDFVPKVAAVLPKSFGCTAKAESSGVIDMVIDGDNGERFSFPSPTGL